MDDNHDWVSAYFPHPFRPNEVVQAYWREQQQPGAVGVEYGFCYPINRSFIHVVSSADPLGLRVLFERTLQ